MWISPNHSNRSTSGDEHGVLCRHRRRKYTLIDQLLEIGWGKQKNGPPTGQGWRAALTPTVVGAFQAIDSIQDPGM